MYGVTAITSVSAGRTSASSWLVMGTLGSICDTAGKIWKTCVASSRMSRMPTTKSGRADRVRPPRTTVESNQPISQQAAQAADEDGQRDADEGGQQHQRGGVPDALAKQRGHGQLGDKRIAHVALSRRRRAT